MPPRLARSPAARAALGVLIIGLLVRALVCFTIVPRYEIVGNVAPTPDEYPDLAETLLEKGELGFGKTGASPSTTRGPGFPLWLAAGIRIGGSNPRWLGLWTSLPGLAAAVVIAMLLTRRWGRTAGWSGGVIAAMHPLAAIASGRVMSDEYHGALAFLGVVFWVAAIERDEPLLAIRQSASSMEGREAEVRFAALFAAIFFSFHLLTRSSGLLTLAALVALLFVWRVRRKLLFAIPLLLAFAVALTWSVRPSRLEGRFVFVHSLAGYNFWLGEAFHRVSGDMPARDRWRAAHRLIGEKSGREIDSETFRWGSLTPEDLGEMEPRLQRAAVDHVRSNPGAFAGRYARGLYRFWIGAEVARRTKEYAIFLLPLLAITIFGAFVALRAPPPLDRLVLVAIPVIVLHNAAYAAFLPVARMSAQIAPFVAYLAGIGIQAALARFGAGGMTRSVRREFRRVLRTTTWRPV